MSSLSNSACGLNAGTRSLKIKLLGNNEFPPDMEFHSNIFGRLNDCNPVLLWLMSAAYTPCNLIFSITAALQDPPPPPPPPLPLLSLLWAMLDRQA